MLVLFVPMAFSQGGKDTRAKKIRMPLKVPTEGNSWFFINEGTDEMQPVDFSNYNWVSTDSLLRTYFYLGNAGTVHIGVSGTVVSGTTSILATFQGETKEVELQDKGNKAVYIGSFSVPSAGYYFVDLQRTEQSDGNSDQSVAVKYIALGGEATSLGVHYANKDYSYWGRRGPSVHLQYEVPSKVADVQWFYSEVTVPEGSDVVGSYFMANGFEEGYFGMQVKSSSERIILFSVWSPYNTDNSSTVPKSQRVELVAKGDPVTVNDFGGEGSGGQSYLRFNWDPETTYGFLLGAEPTGDNKTDYFAYFFDPK